VRLTVTMQKAVTSTNTTRMNPSKIVRLSTRPIPGSASANLIHRQIPKSLAKRPHNSLFESEVHMVVGCLTQLRVGSLTGQFATWTLNGHALPNVLQRYTLSPSLIQSPHPTCPTFFIHNKPRPLLAPSKYLERHAGGGAIEPLMYGDFVRARRSFKQCLKVPFQS